MIGVPGGSPFGLDPKDDYPRLEQVGGDPAFGENHAFWLLATDGSVFINAHLNSVDSCWALRRAPYTCSGWFSRLHTDEFKVA